jgi:hypothetical protein
MGGQNSVANQFANTMTGGVYNTVVHGQNYKDSAINAYSGGLDKVAGQAMGLGKDLFPGADQIRDPALRMSPEALAAEQAILARQGAIASGEAPSPTAMQYQQALNQAAQAQMQAAASARGVNPALAMRSAGDATMRATAEASREQAVLQEQERRRADEVMAQIAQNQRGGALGVAQANLQARTGYRQGNIDMLSGMGQAGLSAFGGGGK